MKKDFAKIQKEKNEGSLLLENFKLKEEIKELSQKLKILETTLLQDNQLENEKITLLNQSWERQIEKKELFNKVLK